MKPIFNLLQGILISDYKNKAAGWKNNKIFKMLNNNPSFDNNGFVESLVKKAFRSLDDNDVKEYIGNFIMSASKDEVDVLRKIIHKKYPKYEDTLNNFLLLK